MGRVKKNNKIINLKIWKIIIGRFKICVTIQYINKNG